MPMARRVMTVIALPFLSKALGVYENQSKVHWMKDLVANRFQNEKKQPL